VYAVTAFVQRQRTPEYGLKLAIGAPPRAMAREILGETLVVAAVGLAFGLAGAALSLRLLSGHLFEIGASDVAAYATAVVTIAATALLAAAAPALRAARIDPMRALRNE
jgi:ABC-type antimicrobial peptide transport system permease subunit